MITIAQRNRAIKRTLEQAFGRGKVTVRGSRGTGYGWVSVRIDWTPRDPDQGAAMRAECKALLHAAKIDLGHTYTDDTCEYATDQCSIEFNNARYRRTMAMSDGRMAVMLHCDDTWRVAT